MKCQKQSQTEIIRHNTAHKYSITVVHLVSFIQLDSAQSLVKMSLYLADDEKVWNFASSKLISDFVFACAQRLRTIIIAHAFGFVTSYAMFEGHVRYRIAAGFYSMTCP